MQTDIITGDKNIDTIDRTALKTLWKQHLASATQHEGWHHLLYAVLRGKSAEKIKKAFPPAHTPGKIRNYACQGRGPAWKFEDACNSAMGALQWYIRDLSRVAAGQAEAPKGLYLNHLYANPDAVAIPLTREQAERAVEIIRAL